jgi:hypothetical protein
MCKHTETVMANPITSKLAVAIVPVALRVFGKLTNFANSRLAKSRLKP